MLYQRYAEGPQSHATQGWPGDCRPERRRLDPGPPGQCLPTPGLWLRNQRPGPKTFGNQAVLFLYLAYWLGDQDMSELNVLPDLLSGMPTATDEPARQVVSYLSNWNTVHYLGYGLTHPIALEGALKLKEITCAHCEGMFSSEFKHGRLSVVHDSYPVLFITALGDEAMMINHVNEVTTRGGRAIAIAEENTILRGNVHDYLTVFASGRLFASLLLKLPDDLIAYYLSVAHGIDPDFPWNLSNRLAID